MVTNSGGSLVEATSYDPWGKVLSGGTSLKYQYTGQEKDSETGLNYYGSRYYGSAIQHFVQPDSIIPNVYNPQQLNRYAYANNNPLKYVDPTGHVGEILKYNAALTQYYKKPSAITYNNVLNTASSIQKQSGTTSSSGSNSNNNSGSSNNSGGSSVVASAGVAAGGSLIRQNYINGKNFQDAVHVMYDFARNNQGLGSLYNNRIPDGLGEAVRECKGGAYICNTQQIKDMMRYAKDNGLPFELYYKESARVAGTVREAIATLNEKGGPGARLIPVAAGVLAPTVLDAVPLFINPSLISPNYSNYGNGQQL